MTILDRRTTFMERRIATMRDRQRRVKKGLPAVDRNSQATVTSILSYLIRESIRLAENPQQN